MTNRRQFLSFAALGLASTPALADSLTYQSFHAALEQNARLSVYADHSGDLAGQATVLGALPKDLSGVFYRNGPGRFELGGERYHHWFDGDGFAQRWQIGDGKVSHIGRFVATQKFVDESKAGQFLYPAFGTYVDRKGMKNNDTVNVANTNLLPLNGRLYALWEGGSATEMDPQTLATRGIKTWRSDLKAMPFSAHPKMDPDGGLWNFGTAPGSNKLIIYRLNAQGEVTRTAMLPVPQLNMVHDFVVSGRHLIFLVAPYDLGSESDTSFADRMHWAGKRRPLRAVVISKDTLTLRQVFELPARSVFHLGNAYEDGACTRLDAVLHEGDALRKVALPMRGDSRMVGDNPSSTVQITLDYASGQAREARLFGVSEFPRVMPQVVSSRHRKLLVLGAAGRELILDSVNLIDTDSGKVDGYTFGAGWQVEEHVLVPRRGARSETDGYVVGVAQDTRRAQSVLTVFDAHNIKAGPMALARLPYRAPVCFHGNFQA
ncbi:MULTISPECIES: carotenoid oxygenase family protein [unclassified Duganella]|uniref:carotenoid oxygenase family protein n=1 Tax=unclassified Duganella TaxID=2636909 RepID=UPI0008800D60|nr:MULTISPECIES: carotenoid oxygenase family protein [unclassified Duganella]SDF78242.1 carotenoid cleavage dioxygenase [Duganella sp. OV458]SDI50823.1 carotenoid cleavage dioxygenase [Duganella sp. OV510]